MNSLRVLVVGHGLIGRQRAAALVALRERLPVELAGTVDPVPRSADSHPGVPHYGGLEQVPSGTYDAAVIAVPHDLAPPLAVAVLSTGAPILIEKPLAVNSAQAREIARAAGGVGKPSFVGFNYRFLPTIRRLFEHVDAGALGRLRNIDMLLGHGGHRRSAESWKLSLERAGGGVLLDPGVHLLDLLLRLAPGVRCVHAGATRGFWKTGIEEDAVSVFCRDALLATLRVSHVRWVNTFRIEVFGEEGYTIVEGRGGNYGPQTIRFGRRWAWSEDHGRSQRETEEVDDFGSADESLADELEAVATIWLGDRSPTLQPKPATMAEALEVTEVWESMHTLIDGHE